MNRVITSYTNADPIAQAKLGIGREQKRTR